MNGVKSVMVKDRVLGKYGLGLTMDEVAERVVGGINITTTRNNNIGIINVGLVDET